MPCFGQLSSFVSINRFEATENRRRARCSSFYLDNTHLVPPIDNQIKFPDFAPPVRKPDEVSRFLKSACDLSLPDNSELPSGNLEP